MLVYFIALPSQVFETPFIFEQVFYWSRPRLSWELHEENVLENTLVYVVVRREQNLETVGEGGDRLALAHPEAE